MAYLILTFLAGLILFFAPLIISSKLSKKWMIPRRTFWRAGAFHAFIMLFYMAVLGNLSSVFPGITSLNIVWKALITAVITGLFVELGRFVVLDRFMKQIRKPKEIVYFGFSWTGFNAFIIGILTLLNAFGMYYLMNIQDIKTEFPQASSEQIELLEEANKQINEESQNTFMAIAPLVENASMILIDIAMSIIILFAITKMMTRFVWLAVGFKILVNFTSLALFEVNFLLSEAVFIFAALISFFIIRFWSKHLVHLPTS